jgi:DNA polymerase-1
VLAWSTANEEAKQLKQWLQAVNLETRRTFPQANQFGTVTHRFSYHSPNLQQVKKSVLRSIIVPPEGHLILRADFKTLELVIGAVFHKETAILEQIVQGADLHRLTASFLFGVVLSKITDGQRHLGKLTNLSLEFGRGLEGYIRSCRLARVTMTKEELTLAYQKFNDAWPNLTAYRNRISNLVARGKHEHEIRSMYGRLITLDPSLTLRELRGAFLNYPIQTSASDLLKLTMRYLWQHKEEGISILASVHDELLLTVRPEKIARAKGLLQEAADAAGKLVLGDSVPVRLEMGAGRNWWEAIKNAE